MHVAPRLLCKTAASNKQDKDSTRQSSVMPREETLALKRRDDSSSHGLGELIVQLPELMRSFCFPVCTTIKPHTTGCVRFL